MNTVSNIGKIRMSSPQNKIPSNKNINLIPIVNKIATTAIEPNKNNRNAKGP